MNIVVDLGGIDFVDSSGLLPDARPEIRPLAGGGSVSTARKARLSPSRLRSWTASSSHIPTRTCPERYAPALRPSFIRPRA
jgi:hypothetical protein